MIKIDGKEVVFAETLLIHQDKEAWVEFQIENWTVRTKIIHQKTEEKGSNLTIQGKGDFAEVCFQNWNSPLGTATTEPIEIGITDKGHKLFITAAESFIGGSVRKLFIQFLREATNG